MAGTQYGRMVGGIASVTAGTTQTQAGATELTGALNLVTTGNASDGVILQSGRSAGDVVRVVNISGVALKVYPPTGGAINGGTANASVTVKANSMSEFVHTGSGNYGGMFDV